MSVILSKGGRVNLSKDHGLKKVQVCLGWQENAFDTGRDFDLDATAFVCKLNSENKPKIINDEYMVFYNNLTSPDGAVTHSGDNLIGDSDGDDEVITVDLETINEEAAEISFVVTIHEAIERKQNFGQVEKSYIRLVDVDSGKEVARYSLEEDFSTETSVQFGSLYKNDKGEWLFKAVGSGYNQGLREFAIAYGVSV